MSDVTEQEGVVNAFLRSAPKETIRLFVEEYEVDIDAIFGKKKSASIMRARHLLWAVLREVHGLSYPELGKIFLRDHTTIMAGVKNIPREVLTAAVEVLQERRDAQRR
jgi:chromosomal replication initiation ATPase DnaA